MTRRFLIVALIAVVFMIAGAGALYEWLVPGLSSARTEPGLVETKIATWLLHHSVPPEAKARTNPRDPTAPKSRLVATCSVRNAKSATVMTAAEKRDIGQANIRGHQRSVRWMSHRCRTVKFFITSAMASVTPACPRGKCPTGNSGSSSPLFAICRRCAAHGAARGERPGRRCGVRTVRRLGCLPEMP